MARPLRLEFPGAISSDQPRQRRQKVSLSDADRELFLSILSRVVSRYGWLCHAYCVMANRYHLLIETPKANLSIGMRQLNGIYTQSFNRRHNRVGHLFQGRFKAIRVERESHLLELCRYIVLNPLRVKGSGRAQTWKWSSYRNGWTGASAGVSEHGLDTHPIRQETDTSAEAVPGIVSDGFANRLWEDLKGQIYLGRGLSEKHAARNQDLKEIPRVQLGAKPSLQRKFAKSGEKAIAEAYDHGYRLHEIAARLGVHYATVSRRLKKIEKRGRYRVALQDLSPAAARVRK
jgi:putative transposase